MPAYRPAAPAPEPPPPPPATARVTLDHRSILDPEWCTRRADEISRDLPRHLDKELERIRRTYDVVPHSDGVDRYPIIIPKKQDVVLQ